MRRAVGVAVTLRSQPAQQMSSDHQQDVAVYYRRSHHRVALVTAKRRWAIHRQSVLRLPDWPVGPVNSQTTRSEMVRVSKDVSPGFSGCWLELSLESVGNVARFAISARSPKCRKIQ